MTVDTPLESVQQHQKGTTTEQRTDAKQQQQAGVAFEEPRLIHLDKIRFVYIEDKGTFADVAPKLWSRFRTDLANCLTTTHRFVGAGFVDKTLWDAKKEYGGVFRAGAFQEEGTAHNKVLDEQVQEGMIEGSFIQFVVNGKIDDYEAAWKHCFETAKGFDGVSSLELFDGRPCVEIFLNVPEDGEKQLDGGIVTELLVPVTLAA